MLCPEFIKEPGHFQPGGCLVPAHHVGCDTMCGTSCQVGAVTPRNTTWHRPLATQLGTGAPLLCPLSLACLCGLRNCWGRNKVWKLPLVPYWPRGVNLLLQPHIYQIPAFSRFGKTTFASANSEFMPLYCNDNTHVQFAPTGDRGVSHRTHPCGHPNDCSHPCGCPCGCSHPHGCPHPRGCPCGCPHACLLHYGHRHRCPHGCPHSPHWGCPDPCACPHEHPCPCVCPCPHTHSLHGCALAGAGGSAPMGARGLVTPSLCPGVVLGRPSPATCVPQPQAEVSPRAHCARWAGYLSKTRGEKLIKRLSEINCSLLFETIWK